MLFVQSGTVQEAGLIAGTGLRWIGTKVKESASLDANAPSATIEAQIAGFLRMAQRRYAREDCEANAERGSTMPGGGSRHGARLARLKSVRTKLNAEGPRLDDAPAEQEKIAARGGLCEKETASAGGALSPGKPRSTKWDHRPAVGFNPIRSRQGLHEERPLGGDGFRATISRLVCQALHIMSRSG